MNADVDTITATILSLERCANERWNKGNIEGPSSFYAEDVTYL